MVFLTAIDVAEADWGRIRKTRDFGGLRTKIGK